jgi:hypothetical protein
VSAVYYKKERVRRRVDKVLSGVIRSDLDLRRRKEKKERKMLLRYRLQAL